MGVVWRATDERIGRVVAVKTLPPAYGLPLAQERLAHEARALGRVWDPRVVAVLDYGRDDDGTVYVVMELVEGRTLREAAAAEPPCVTTVLDWIDQILRALEVTHAAGLLHRDIKPANLMVTPAGVVKLLDFGIAKVVQDVSRRLHLTPAGQVVGTPDYMAPELVDPDAAPDARTDLYAVGCVLYRLITRVHPEIGTLLTRVAPPPPSSLVPGLPAELDAVALALLAPLPCDRPADAADARKRIDEAAHAWARVGAPRRGPGGAVGSTPARLRVLVERVRATPGSRGDARELRRLIEDLAWETGAELFGCDLAGLPLSHIDLGAAVLTEVNLKGADLRGAALGDAKLGRADLTEAVLNRATLNRALLFEADLTHADLMHANLVHARMGYARLTHARLHRANLTDANLAHAILDHVDAPRANLSEAYLKRASLVGAILARSTLTRANLAAVDLTRADLTGASLVGADLTDADLTDAASTGTRLGAATWSDATRWPSPGVRAKVQRHSVTRIDGRHSVAQDLVL